MNLRTMRSTEHDIQSALFSWAQLQTSCYPELALMFAIPNGGKREKRQDKKGRWFSPTAQKLKKEGVKPYICPIANMIMDQLIEKLKYETTYLAKLDFNEKTRECQVKCAIYKTPDKIGLVSDWSKEEL